jgi:hypothetical protein
VTLPGNRTVEETVDARAGHTHWLDLVPDDEGPVSRPVPALTDPVVPVSKGPGDLPPGWRVALLRVRPPTELVDAGLEPDVRSVWQRQVELGLPGDRAYFADVSTLDSRCTVALPGRRRCVLVHDAGETVAYPADRLAQLATQYLAFEDSEAGALLFPNGVQERMDPFGAVAGGYLFLRLGRLDRLAGWPERLAARLPWLPDGAVIAGERAALSGDHGAAVEFFLAAAARGLPVFTDGFSILVSRLRQYEHELAGAYGRLAPHVDFGAPTTTIVSPGPAPGSARR